MIITITSTRTELRHSVQSPVRKENRLQTRLAIAAVCLLLLVSFGCKSKPESHAAYLVTVATPGSVKPERPTTIRLNVALGGKPVDSATVHGVQNMVTMDMGKTEMDFKSVGAGNYEAVTEFSMSGPWKIDVTVKDNGHTMNSQVNVNVVD
jgi:hypothetical protein